jgi:hypothetical protein
VTQCVICLKTATWLAETYVLLFVHKVIVVLLCAFVLPLLYVQMVIKLLVPYNMCGAPWLVGKLLDFHEGHCSMQ